MRYKTWYVVSVASLLWSGFSVIAFAEGILGVTNIVAGKTYAQAGGGYTAGWRWTLSVTVPDNEPVLRLKFGNWTNASSSFSPAGNVRFYSAQSSNAANSSNAVPITTTDTYSNPLNLLPITTTASDISSTTPGRQIEVVVETKIPADAAGGSYIGSFGIQTLPDTAPPVITLVGNASVTIERGTAYIEPGATAVDNIDGTLASSSIAVSGAVTSSSIGTYILSYNVADAAGNASAPITRTVLVQDTIAPTGSVSYSTTATTSADVIATLTPSEPVTFLNTTGIATTTSGTATTTFTENGSFSFLFADVAQNTGSTTASVANIDKVSPAVSSTTLNGATANVAVNIVSTPVALTLTASESVNWLTLKIEKADDPSVYKVFQSGNLCEDWTTTCTKTWDGTLPGRAITDGTYRIKVHIKDAADNAFNDYLGPTITVDTTAPILTVSGDTTIMHNLGTVYTDEGATAVDARDGSVSVSSSGSVDVNTVGDYMVTYTSTDALGNVATATRTVQVRPILVSSISVSGTGGATTVSLGSTLQIEAAVSPANATNQAVSWTVFCDNVPNNCPGGQRASNFDGGGTINASGLFTTVDSGNARIRATAADGSGVFGDLVITITN